MPLNESPYFCFTLLEIHEIARIGKIVPSHAYATGAFFVGALDSSQVALVLDLMVSVSRRGTGGRDARGILIAHQIPPA